MADKIIRISSFGWDKGTTNYTNYTNSFMLDDFDFIELNEFLAARFAGAEWGHLVEACAALRYGFVKFDIILHVSS